MFERILEKILVNQLGQFIDGIDKNSLKLSIWSGNLSICNISLKQEVIRYLELPIHIFFSSIGKLDLKIPWKSLGSSPVEILLEDVFVFLQPINQSEWIPVDLRNIHLRMDFLEMLINEYMKKIIEARKALEGKKEEDNESGMIKRMTAKVIDNLQVTIRNIHVRYEEPYSSKKFALGITLEEILIFTCNSKWEKEYIDRTDTKNKLLPMRKMLSLNNLGLYWNSEARELLGGMTSENIREGLNNLITSNFKEQNKSNYIFIISASCMLTEKNKKDLHSIDNADYELYLELQAIDVHLKKTQLEDLIHLLEFFGDYATFKLRSKVAKQREIENLTSEQRETNKKEFLLLFDKFQRYENKDELKGLPKIKAVFNDPEKEDLFKELLITLSDEEISDIVKAILKEIERDHQTRQIYEKKHDRSKWIKGFFMKQIEKETNDDNEIDKIESYLKDTFQAEDNENGKIKELANRKIYSLSFLLKGGNFYFSEITPDNNEEGVNFYYKNLSSLIEVSTSHEIIKTTLCDYGLSLKTKYSGNSSYIETAVIHRLNDHIPRNQNENAIEVIVEQNPSNKPIGKYVTVNFDKMEFIYRPAAIDRLKRFFDVSSKDEDLNARAKEGLNDMKNKATTATKNVNPTTMITANFSAPIIVLPFLQNNDIKSKCWVFHFGDLVVKTQQDLEKTLEYQTTELTLKKTKMQCFSSMELYTKYKISPGSLAEEDCSNIFNVIEEFNIEGVLQTLSNFDAEVNKPRKILKLFITEVNLNANSTIYRDLLTIDSLFTTKESVELIENEKIKLIQGQKKIGIIYVLEKRLGLSESWVKYFCILKGSYLYFFTNSNDPRPAFHYFLSDVKSSIEFIENRMTFQMEKDGNKFLISAEDEQELTNWRKAIEAKIIENQQKKKAIVSELNIENQKQEEKKIDYNILNFQLLFQISQVKLCLFKEDQSRLAELKTDNFIFNFTSKESYSKLDIRLEAVELFEYLHLYRNPDLSGLITSISQSPEAKQALFSIGIEVIDKDHPNYEIDKTSLKVDIKFGNLYLNYKPDVVLEIMRILIQPKTNKDKMKTIEIQEDTERRSIGSIDKIDIDVKVSIEEVCCRMIHQISHTAISSLSLSKASVRVKLYPLNLEVHGSLGNLQIFDLTNYPNTIHSDAEFEKLSPYEMVGVQNVSDNLLEFSYTSMEKKHPRAFLLKNMLSSLNLKIHSIKINFIYQPTMRVIDFIFDQLVPSLRPYSSNNNEEIRSLESVKLAIERPEFLDLTISMESPIVNLKPLPESSEYIEIRLGDLFLENKIIENTQRIKASELSMVYCDQINIQFKDMGFYKKTGSSIRQISEKFYFSFSVERLLLEKDYKILCDSIRESTGKEIKIDNRYNLIGKMSPVICTIHHNDYLLIMKCINFNIIFEDRKNNLFAMKSTHQTNSEKKYTPFTMVLNFENFSVIAIDNSSLNPFSVLTLQSLSIDLSKVKNPMKIEIKASEFDISYLDTSQDGYLVEKKILGKRLEKERFFEVSDSIKILQGIREMVKQESQIFKEKNSLKDNLNLDVYIEMDFETNKDKKIQIGIDNIRVYLFTAIYLKLLEFINVDNSVRPIEHIESKSENDRSETEDKTLNLKLDVKKFIIILPSINSLAKEINNGLVLQGGVHLNHRLSPDPELSELVNIIKSISRPIHSVHDHKCDEAVVSETYLGLKDTAILLCDLDALEGSESMNDVKKRIILQPLNIHIKHRLYKVPNKKLTALMKLEDFDIFFFPIILRVSYKDFVLVLNSVYFQLDKLKPEMASPKKLRPSSSTLNLRNYERRSSDFSIKPRQRSERRAGVRSLERNEVESDGSDSDSEDKLENGSIIPNPEEKKEEKDGVEDYMLDEKKIQIIDIAADEKLKELEGWEPDCTFGLINSEGIQLVLINDANDILVPVLEVSIFQIPINFVKSKSKMKITGNVSILMSYFNPFPSKWEPILEKCLFGFEYIDRQNPQKTIRISQLKDSTVLTSLDEMVNLTISDSMVSTLYSTVITWRDDYEIKKYDTIKEKKNIRVKQDEVEELIEYVSPYTIKNETGYTVEIESQTGYRISAQSPIKPKSKFIDSRKASPKKEKVYQIENGYSSQLLVESSIERFSSKEEKNNLIKLKINHPALDISTVDNIDIDSQGINSYQLSINTLGPLALKGLSLYSEVRIVNSKKIITILSPIRFVNMTTVSYHIIIASGKDEILQINPGDTISIPFDLVNEGFYFKSLDTNSISNQLFFQDYLTADPKLDEIHCGNYYFWMKSNKIASDRNLYEFTMESPFAFINCLPVKIQLQISTEESCEKADIIELAPQEICKLNRLSRRNNLFMKMSLSGFNWGNSIKIYRGSSHQKSLPDFDEIVLKDHGGFELNLKLYSSPVADSKKEFFIYAKIVVINESPYNLYFQYKTKTDEYSVAGQIPSDHKQVFSPKILLLNETDKIIISRSERDEKSKPISLKAIGTTEAELVSDDQTSLLELGIDVSLIPCQQADFLYTKTVTINPRYIFLNETNFKIGVKYESGGKNYLILEPGNRYPLYWHKYNFKQNENSPEKQLKLSNVTNQKVIYLQLIEKGKAEDYWNTSKEITLTNLGDYNMRLHSKDDSERKYVRVTVNLKSSILFASIQEQPESDINLKIRNSLKGVKLIVYEQGLSFNKGLAIQPGETIPFGWVYPSKNKQVRVDLILDNNITHSEPDFKFSFDEVQELKTLKVMIGKNDFFRFYVVVVIEGNSRVMKFYEDYNPRSKAINDMVKKFEEEKVKLDIELNIQDIGISLVSTIKQRKKEKRKEILYILVKGIEFRYIHSSLSLFTELKAKYVNIDNNSAIDTSFPVIFTPSSPPQYNPESRVYHFEFSLKQILRSSKIPYLDNLNISLDPSTVKIEGHLVDIIYETANRFISMFQSEENVEKRSITQSLFFNTREAIALQDRELFELRTQWRTKEIPKFKKSIFIRQFTLAPIVLSFSFNLKREGKESPIFIINFLNSALGQVIKLDSAPIKLPGIQMKNVFNSASDIASNLISKYKTDVKISYFSLIGSLEIVGNPVGLFQNISSGIQDLYDKPTQGASQGPVELGKGIILGAGSFVKKTVSGTMNSIGKVSDSLAGGISSLSLDDEYMKIREKRKVSKPTHLGEGIYQGIHTIGNGIVQGLKGVITKPIQGAQEKGIKGFFIGTFQGISGLFVKPVAGLFDATTMAAEGVKKTATIFDDHPNECRMRYPRPFYGKEKYYKAYNEIDAKFLWYLSTKENIEFEDLSLIAAFDTYPNQNNYEDCNILALFSEKIFYWSSKYEKLLWKFSSKDILSVELFNDAVQIQFKTPLDQLKNSIVVVKNCYYEDNRFITKKLLELMNLQG